MMIDLIARLIETGHAYAVPSGSVYFDARSFPSYGELSGNRLGDLRPGHRSGARAGQPPADQPRAGQPRADQQSLDPDKRFHADWALWKAARAGRELTYAAPWGSGFPGWHAECSAMSLQLPGRDHRRAHRRDRPALSPTTRMSGPSPTRSLATRSSSTGSTASTCCSRAERWPSPPGTWCLLADLTARGLDPLALRLALLDHRYRQQLNLTWAVLEAADRTVRRWRERVAEWARSPSKPMCAEYVSDFAGAFDDDLDTPAALRVLRNLEKDGEIPPGAKFETFAYADHLLGLDLARDIGRSPRRAPSPMTRQTCWRRARPPVPRPTALGGPAPRSAWHARRHGDRHASRPDLDRPHTLSGQLRTPSRARARGPPFPGPDSLRFQLGWPC